MRKVERLTEKQEARIRKLWAALPRTTRHRVKKGEAELLARDFGIAVQYLRQLVREGDGPAEAVET
jgi:hypothetical protein